MKSEEKLTFRGILKGNLSKIQAGIYLGIYLSVYYFLLIISYLIFIRYQPYSMQSRFISHLGMPGENPNGFLFFSIAALWNGLLFLPMNFYFYRKFLQGLDESRMEDKNYRIMAKIIRIFSILSFLFGLLSEFGTILIGLFFQDFSTDSSNVFHMIGVFFSFGGIYCGIFSSFMVLLFRKIIKLPSPRDFFFVFYHLQFLIVSVIFLMVGLLDRVDPGIFSVYFWEWMTIFSVSVWVIGILRDMPN